MRYFHQLILSNAFKTKVHRKKFNVFFLNKFIFKKASTKDMSDRARYLQQNM